MIRGMVDGLAARLKQDGSDVDGWVKLVRSYKVLGEQDKAQTAISDAQRALANDPDKRKLLDSGSNSLKAVLSPSQPALFNQPARSLRRRNMKATRSRAWWPGLRNA